MKYFSEDIVREMVKEAEDIAFNRSCGVKTEPLDIEDYPSIEIKEPHGRLIDADILQAELEEHSYPPERCWYYAEAGQFIDEAETVLEASIEGEASK